MFDTYLNIFLQVELFVITSLPPCRVASICEIELKMNVTVSCLAKCRVFCTIQGFLRKQFNFLSISQTVTQQLFYVFSITFFVKLDYYYLNVDSNIQLLAKINKRTYSLLKQHMIKHFSNRVKMQQ